MKAIDLAYQIIDMQDEIDRLRVAEIRGKEFERKYYELLDESTKEAQRSVGGLLSLMLDDRIKIQGS
jgi:hypothetical protein